jgi:type I restriction enzyme S subunit
MSSRKVKLSDFLIRSKIPVDIEDNKQYKRVTIRTKHQGVSVRDIETGSKIGTKKQFLLKAGQFVLSKIDAMYGAFGIAPDEVDGAIITGNFWAYDYDKKMVSIEWLNHFTNSPDFYDLCRRASTGITHRKYLDEDFFLSYEVNLPDINEQENLVVSIDAIRDKVSAIEKELSYQLTQLENLNQAILQEAVQGKLVPQDPNDEPASEMLKRIKAEKAKSGKKDKPLPPIKPEEIPFEISENWVWCRLGEMSINRDGERQPISQSERNGRQKIYDYYGASGVIDKIDGYTHEGELLLIGEDGANLVTRSTPIAFLAKGQFWVNNHAHVLDTVDRITLDYLCAYVNSIDLKPFVTGGFQPKLSQGNLNIIPVPLPPLSEQKRIVAEIETQFAKTKQLKEHIIANQQATEQLLKALLHQAFEVEEVEEV